MAGKRAHLTGERAMVRAGKMDVFRIKTRVAPPHEESDIPKNVLGICILHGILGCRVPVEDGLRFAGL